MHFGVSGKSVQLAGQFHGEGVGIFPQGEVGTFTAFGQRGREIAGADLRNMFREAADLKFRDAEGLGDLGEGGAGLVGGKAADDGAMVRPVTAEKKFDHFVPTVVREIDVDIREFVHDHPVAVEETAEVEIEPDRADAGDAEAVADQGVRGRAPGNPVDSLSAAILKQVPDEEKIVGIADLANDPQFFDQLAKDAAVQGRFRSIATTGAVTHQPAEEVARRGVVRRDEAGKAQPSEIERERALFGEAQRFAKRTGVAPAAAESFGG